MHIEGRKSRLVAVDCLLEFVECAAHAFVRAKGLYTSFRTCKRLGGRTVFLATDKDLYEYVKQFCFSIRDLILTDRVNSLIFQSDNSRFFIELPSDFSRVVFYALPAIAHRSDLEIAETAFKVLTEAMDHLERKLCATKSPKSTQWEILVDVKRNPIPGTQTNTPSGFSLVKDPVKGIGYSRNPIKSCVLANSVVVSMYQDNKTLDTEEILQN